MLVLFPAGFEEVDHGGELELAVYTDPEGERSARAAFGDADATRVGPGWEDEWKRFHHPVRIGPLWVGPPWERPEPDALAVVIDPGRAFGTGAHPTTRLCLELLLGLERASFLDLGCGSGVLAIAAAKLDFAPVLALDSDPAAVAATTRNARANGVRVDARAADVGDDPLPPAEVAAANIALAAVERAAQRVAARFLVASGYLVGDRLELPGWTRVDRRELDGWAADLFARVADAGR